MAMDERLDCQTDETTDARALYTLALGEGECDDCLLAAQLRGAALVAPCDDDEVAGELTSLARAGLGLGQRAGARGLGSNAAAELRPVGLNSPRKPGRG